MEKNLKEQIVKSVAAVKKKVEIMKDAKNKNNMALEAIFKPIADPLNQLVNKSEEKSEQKKSDHEPKLKKIKYNESEPSYSSNEDYEDFLSEDENLDEVFTEKPNQTLTVSPSEEHNVSEGSFKSLQSSPSMKNQSLSWSTTSDVMAPVPFGVKSERGKLWLGKTRVFDRDHTLKIGNHILKKTSGLMELLFKKIPKMDVITDEDLHNYKLLLIETNAHRRNSDPNKPINSNKGYKYMNIIKPLFKFSRSVTTSSESLPQGKGIKLLKSVKKDTDLVYWDDPNELVERLKLLLASRDAGNTGLDNEIIAIIEELHEAGIINKNIKKMH